MTDTDTIRLMWQQRTYALEAELHEAQVENAKLKNQIGKEVYARVENWRSAVERLQAENAKLREALKEIAVYAPTDDVDLRQCALIARAALKVSTAPQDDPVTTSGADVPPIVNRP